MMSSGQAGAKPGRGLLPDSACWRVLRRRSQWPVFVPIS